jgi:Leucine-rich repeat (LRR) protein
MTTSQLPGLIGWWSLHDGDGRVTDRLGQSKGSVTGAEPRPHLQSDRLEPKHSLYFSHGDYATIPDAPNVSTGDFSVCLWMKTSGYYDRTEVLLDKRIENSDSVRGWHVFLYNGQLGFQIADGKWSNFLLGSSTLPTDGNWHHLAVTIDRDQSSGGRWYIDGRAVGSPFSVTHHAGSLSNEFPLTLGRRSDGGGGFFGGYLSDIRLYERALTAEQIYQVYGSIAADEPASRILVTPPPGGSSAASAIKTSEPLSLPEAVPLIGTIPQPEITPDPAIAALPEVTQSVPMDADLKRVRQQILNSLDATELYLQDHESHHYVTHLPSEIGQLHNLQKLKFVVSNLRHLPPEIGQLHNLQVFDLAGRMTHYWHEQLYNQLTHLPPEIGQLHNLQSLRLTYNQLTHLPPEIGQLQNLHELILFCNSLTHLPPEIGQLQNLQTLDLQYNKLTHLPPEIGQLQNLQSLKISYAADEISYAGSRSTQLTHLPPEIGQLQNLQTLKISNNQLTELPPEIGQLQNLQSLDLDNNSLTELPPEIGQLQNLQSLDLDKNSLTHLPPEIGQLQNLQSLDLDNNSLTHLPPEIGQLQNLQKLDLDNNSLTHLPPEIGQLQNLQKLRLCHNKLTHLPPEIGQLQNLQELSLSNKQLTHLPPEIGQLHNLQTLDLSNNQLTHLLPEIGQLHNLQTLDLSDNQLTHLPPEIGQLHKLGELKLRGNPIQDFSPLSNHPNPDLYLLVGQERSYLRLPRQYWAHPSQWQAEWLLTETNAELRRMLLHGIGYDRLCQELQATELDTWREYTLLKIDAAVDVEPIHLLKMTCPSTAHIHTLRVPPTLTSAHEAIQWANWDIDPEAFAAET